MKFSGFADDLFGDSGVRSMTYVPPLEAETVQNLTYTCGTQMSGAVFEVVTGSCAYQVP